MLYPSGSLCSYGIAVMNQLEGQLLTNWNVSSSGDHRVASANFWKRWNRFAMHWYILKSHMYLMSKESKVNQK